MKKSYWFDNGKHQQLLVQLSPFCNRVDVGAIPQGKFPALDKLNDASNCYLELWEFGHTMPPKKFEETFGFDAAPFIDTHERFGSKRIKFDEILPKLEPKMDALIRKAAKELKIV